MRFVGYKTYAEIEPTPTNVPFIEVELAPHWYARIQGGECRVVNWVSAKRRNVIDHVPATRQSISECMKNFNAEPWEWALDFIEKIEANLKARRTFQ
ncbi:MAG: hypothetical protein VB959_02050 [Rhodospirillales bacterium]|jgi:hypothetical protein